MHQASAFGLALLRPVGDFDCWMASNATRLGKRQAVVLP